MYLEFRNGGMTKETMKKRFSSLADNWSSDGSDGSSGDSDDDHDITFGTSHIRRRITPSSPHSTKMTPRCRSPQYSPNNQYAHSPHSTTTTPLRRSPRHSPNNQYTHV